MVLLQNLLSAREVDLVLGPLVPRQLRDPFEVGPDDLVLGRLWARALQPPKLAVHLRALLFVELELFEALTHLLDVVALLLLTELLLNRLELLAQEHLALPLTQLGLDLGLDVFLSVDARQLPLDGHERGPHAHLVVEHLQELLLVLRRKLQIEGHEVGERPGVVDALDELVQRLGRYASSGSQLGRPVPELAIQGLERRLLGVGGTLAVHREQHRVQHALPLVLVRERLSSALALHEELDAAADTVGLDDANHGSDRVQNLRNRIVDVLLLGHGEEAPVSVQRLLHGLHRPGTARRDGYGHARIDDGVSERKYRKGEALAHGILSVSSPTRSAGGSNSFIECWPRGSAKTHGA